MSTTETPKRSETRTPTVPLYDDDSSGDEFDDAFSDGFTEAVKNYTEVVDAHQEFVSSQQSVQKSRHNLVKSITKADDAYIKFRDAVLSPVASTPPPVIQTPTKPSKKGRTATLHGTSQQVYNISDSDPDVTMTLATDSEDDDKVQKVPASKVIPHQHLPKSGTSSAAPVTFVRAEAGQSIHAPLKGSNQLPTVINIPPALDPKPTTAWTVYRGLNGCHGVFDTEEKALEHMQGDDNRAWKKFHSKVRAWQSYLECLDSGVINLICSTSYVKNERFMILEGIKPGVVAGRARLLKNLGYRRGKVARLIGDEEWANEYFCNHCERQLVLKYHLKPLA